MGVIENREHECLYSYFLNEVNVLAFLEMINNPRTRPKNDWRIYVIVIVENISTKMRTFWKLSKNAFSVPLLFLEVEI